MFQMEGLGVLITLFYHLFFFVIYKVLSNCCIQLIKRERGNLGGRVSGVSRVVMIKLVVHSFV